jgi:geranylgeranyl reductase family protein
LNTIYDAIVVGAGPAGAGVATSLAGNGFRVLMLDKESFPRYKACAGGVDGLAQEMLNKLQIDISPVVEDTVTKLQVSYMGRNVNHYSLKDPLALMTMRPALDNLIARAAQERGVEFREGEAAKTAQDNGKTVAVATEKGQYEGRVLVGADGVYSRISKSFGLNKRPVSFICHEIEIRPETSVLDQWRSTIRVDTSLWPLGYGWVFPKKDLLSIGAGVPVFRAKGLVRTVQQFCSCLDLGSYETVKKHSHQIGFHRPGAPLARGRVLVVGDAAGLVDPNTGGGIGWALKSSDMAASVIRSYLSGGAHNLETYSGEIESSIGEQFIKARILRNTVVARYAAFGSRASAHREMWEQVVRVIQGKEQYTDWYGKSKLAPWIGWTSKIPI